MNPLVGMALAEGMNMGSRMLHRRDMMNQVPDRNNVRNYNDKLTDKFEDYVNDKNLNVIPKVAVQYNSPELAEILETYVDTFLEKAMGSGYKAIVSEAKKNGADAKKLREMKGQMMSQYHTDKEGNGIDILSDKYIKRLKKEKKVDLIERLEGISENVKENYASRLTNEAIGNLVSDHDRLDLSKHLGKAFDKYHWEHEDSHITRNVSTQIKHYQALLLGDNKSLKGVGYTQKKEKKK